MTYSCERAKGSETGRKRWRGHGEPEQTVKGRAEEERFHGRYDGDPLDLKRGQLSFSSSGLTVSDARDRQNRRRRHRPHHPGSDRTAEMTIFLTPCKTLACRRLFFS